MSAPFVAEIRIVGFNFAPRGWATCDGQIIPISQNTALFSLLGTTYGGNGRSNFALPNLQGSVPMHPGQGPGLSQYDLGETGGEENVTLLSSQIPAHKHTLSGEDGNVGSQMPSGQLLGQPFVNPRFANLYSNAAGNAAASPAAVSTAGNNQPHNNMQPYLTMLFIIAMQGIFPPRS